MEDQTLFFKQECISKLCGRERWPDLVRSLPCNTQVVYETDSEECEATRSLKRTNWELFKEKLETQIDQIFDMDEIRSRGDIDEEAVESMYC